MSQIECFTRFRPGQYFCYAKVDDAHQIPGLDGSTISVAEDDVAGFQIAVDDTFVVRVFKRFTDLLTDVDGAIDIETAFPG